MAEWARVVNTTTRDFIKGETVEVLRNRKLLAILNDRGRVTMNGSGTEMQWQIRYKQAPMQGFDDSDTITFSRVNRWKNGVLPWRGYVGADSMTKREKIINKGTEALISVFGTIAKNLMQDIEEQFGDQLYIDGNAAANTKLIHGIESFMGVSGTVSSSPVGNPSDTYAGLSTALGVPALGLAHGRQARAIRITISSRRSSLITPIHCGLRPRRPGRIPASRRSGSALSRARRTRASAASWI